MKKSRILIWTCILVCMSSYSSFTQTQPAGGAGRVDERTLSIETSDDVDSMGSAAAGGLSPWDYIRMVLVLGAVVGVIYGIFYLLKRSGGNGLAENRMIRVLSSKGLTSSRTLHLVEVGNQVFLVGAADGNVSLVAEISDKETLDGIRLQAAAAADPEERKSFAVTLAQIFGRGDGAAGPVRQQPFNVAGAQTNNHSSFLKQQRERLKTL